MLLRTQIFIHGHRSDLKFDYLRPHYGSVMEGLTVAKQRVMGVAQVVRLTDQYSKVRKARGSSNSGPHGSSGTTRWNQVVPAGRC
jgi:hypothetical protein